jgi:hypothetical protein
MGRSFRRVAILAAFVAGCAAPASTAHPSTALPSTAASAATPTAEPVATAPPAVTQRVVFGEAAVVDTALAGTDDRYINPGAVIEADGVLHMFANSFSDWPGRMRVPHLTSEDGVDWVLDEDAEVLDTDGDLFPMADPGIDVSTGYIADDGTWVLYLETVSTSPWEVWRMTAPAPRGPWTVDPAPVLQPGATGTFDANGITWPSVVRAGERWAMYYAAVSRPQGRADSIGVAFSDDGVSWTKEPDPVLVPGERWEFGGVDRPRVVATDGGLVMVYAGLELTSRAIATSTDGLTWTKVPGPSIERATFPVVGGAWDAALLHRNGQLEYFLEIGPSTTKIYRATLAWP